MITIGQLADYAGVTVRAVRHYHERGLLPEPPRDASGYRRYGAEHAVALIRIKALVDAGVPLARIETLLASSPAEFDAAVAEIDHDLERRIGEMAAMRERVRRLVSGERLYVPAEVADFLDRMRAAGLSERCVQQERDGWILLRAMSPARVGGWLAEKTALFDDPEFVAVYRAFDEAFDWDPTDPRLQAVADRMLAWVARHGAQSGIGEEGIGDPSILQLVIDATGATSPAWHRLAELAQQR